MEHGCNCGGSHSEIESGISSNLYEKIDLNKVECLNERLEGTGVTVFKTWDKRLDRNKYVESDVDAELLFNIPFTGNVKLKGLIVIGDEELEPKMVKLYKNRPNMVFDDIVSPDQLFILHRDTNGILEYSVKPVKFSSVYHLSLHFSGDGEQIKIYYIGLRGEWSPAHKHGVTICTYEARPLASDHLQDFSEITRQIK